MATTETEAALETVEMCKQQYLLALYRLGQTLPPFSVHKMHLRDHTSDVNDGHTRLMRELRD